MKCVTDNTIYVESIKPLYESEFPRDMILEYASAVEITK